MGYWGKEYKIVRHVRRVKYIRFDAFGHALFFFLVTDDMFVSLYEEQKSKQKELFAQENFAPEN